MPNPQDDISDDLREELQFNVSRMDAPAVDERLQFLASFTRLSAAQHAEQQMLAERQLALFRREATEKMVLAAHERGDSSMFEGPSSGQTSVPSGIVGQARRVLDARHREGALPDHAAQAVERLLDGPDQPVAARWVAAAGSPEYLAAFKKLAIDPVRGHMTFDSREADAYRKVAQIRNAMSTGAGAGGEMVPIMLDPTILLTSAGALDPLRRISRTVQIATTSWRGISSAGSTAEWKAEGATVADASPTLAQPEVPVHLGDAFVPYSFEIMQDAADFTAQLQKVLTDAASVLMAAAYANGTGTGQPTGVLTGLPVGSQVSGGLTMANVVALQNALPPRFQPNANWVADLTTINTIGSYQTANGSLRFPEVAQGRLLRKPLNEGSEVGSLLYGDFQQFLIVDRIASQVEFVQNLLDPTTGRPTGQRGSLLWFRTGSARLVDEAFRVIVA